MSGRLLLVKNGTAADVAPEARTGMSAFLSEDDGRTWLGGLLLDAREKVSYPDGGQDGNQTIHVSWDHDRAGAGEILMARFTEEDVLVGDLASPGSARGVVISRAGRGA